MQGKQNHAAITKMAQVVKDASVGSRRQGEKVEHKFSEFESQLSLIIKNLSELPELKRLLYKLIDMGDAFVAKTATRSRPAAAPFMKLKPSENPVPVKKQTSNANMYQQQALAKNKGGASGSKTPVPDDDSVMNLLNEIDETSESGEIIEDTDEDMEE